MSTLNLRPVKKSSLKLKRSEWYSCRSFEVKHEWGMHSGVVVLKLKSNKSRFWWIPRHEKAKKGVVTGETLWGTGNML